MTNLRAEIAAFIDLEADLLDFKEFETWLGLWEKEGLYVVPVDPETEDYANALNFAYDDDQMRRLRVERLIGGEAISAQIASKTVRSVSRLRILTEEGDTVNVRCAQFIAETRHGKLITYPADVSFTLRRTAEGFRILRKVVRLLNMDHHLNTIAYFL